MKRGFSLLELMVVLAVLGITLAAAVPALRPLEDPDSPERALHEAAGVLRIARRAALKSGAPVTVSIDAATGRYWIRGGDMGDTRPGRLGATWAVAVQTPGPRARFEFRPDGTASADPLTLSTQGRAVRVEVDRWLGEVHESR